MLNALCVLAAGQRMKHWEAQRANPPGEGRFMTAAVAWPHKTREMHNQHIDSTVWNDYKFREGDIVISTYAKSGTTWMQQIISQMLFNGDTELDTQAMSPWVDF